MNRLVLIERTATTRIVVVLLLALVLLIGALPAANAHAADIVASGTCGADGDNLTWALDADGLLTISGTGAMAEYDWGSSPWYSYRDGIRSVVIDDGVTSIGELAFYSCYKLTSVTIPASVTSIGDYAFGYCTGLTSVTIPGSVSNIGKCAFRACENLVTADICEGVTQIYSGMFSDCSNLTCLNIPSTVTSIDEQAFGSCFNLTQIIIDNANPCYSAEGCAVFDKNKETLFFCTQAVTGAYSVPDGVTAIGKNAFAWNDNLTSVTIPASMAIISDNAFEGCHALADMYYKGTLEQWIILDKGNLDETLPDLNLHFGGSTYFAVGTCGDSLTWTLDSDGVLTISGTGAMENYSSNNMPWHSYRSTITSVTIEDGVTHIGASAFTYCENLNEVSIPASVTSIGRSAFSYCSLSSVTIPDSVTSIGFEVFSGCSSLTSVTIPDSVTSIGSYAFYYCSNLTSVTIPDSVTSIGSYAFSGCSKLTSAGPIGSGFDIEFGWTDAIPANAFFGCYSLTSVTIPDSVTSIGSYAFYYCSNLTSVTIPDSVTSIGNYVFSYCSSLNSIFIPDSVTSIGEGAFAYCYGLIEAYISEGVTIIEKDLFNDCYSMTSVNIPKDVTSIGDYAFASCSGLEEITIPDSVTSIGESAFASCAGLSRIAIPDGILSIGYGTFNYCSSLTDVTIPDSVTSIGHYAFYGCSSLTSVAIPDSVTSIGEATFEDCSNLISVTIPDSVNTIGSYAFAGCTSLEAINVDVGNANYSSEDGILFNKDKTELICCPGGKGGAYAIPDSVTGIWDFAFASCSGLEEITIPDSVTSIGESAFASCAGLSRIAIQDGISSIGYGTFNYCSSLTDVTIPDSVTTIGDYAFNGCTSLNSVTIGTSVTNIGDRAFYGCTSLNSVTIPASMTTIGYRVFYNCYSLADVYYGGTYEQWSNITIANGNEPLTRAFKHCTDGISTKGTCGANLTWILYDNGKLVISGTGEIADYSSGSAPWYSNRSNIKSVVIEDGVTGIGDCAFTNCFGLTSVTIPDGVTSIGEYAFRSCYNMISINIPDSVTDIGAGAFCVCEALTAITIPEGVSSIGESTFDGCSSLASINIPSTVESIGEWAFAGCKSLTAINIDSANQYYSAEGGVLFDKNKETLIFCTPAVSGAYSVPDGVTAIGDAAFARNDNLTSVTIPDSVIRIGEAAFDSCTGLANVTIPDSVASIGEGAFNYCTSLAEISIPNGVAIIGQGTFTECSSLSSVTIPNSVTSIGADAFAYCSSLTRVTIPDSVTSIGDGAFLGCSNLAEVTIPVSVTSVGEGAFTDCSSLTEITIPDSVTSIGNWAFAGCASLNSVTIGNGLTGIAEGMFSGCANLTEITIPVSVTSIGDWVFDGCETLADVYYRGTEDQWNMVDIGKGNELLLDATIHFREIIDSGTCGDNLTWELDSFGVLTISGTGEMENYSSNNMPWRSYRGSITSVVIEDGVTSIGNYAFYNCSNLTSVTIPDSVTSIGGGAFAYCTGLTSVTIPDSVASIGYGAFSDCTDLASAGPIGSGCAIEFGWTDAIPENAFSGCSGLTSVTIPDSVTSIGNYAFRYCTGLTSVTIPDSVTSIGDEAFYGCSSLTSVTIGSSVTSIGNYAFEYCSSLTSVVINCHGTYIGWSVFYGCNSLASVTFTDWLFYSERSAGSVFDNSPNLTIYGYSGTWLEGWLANSGINFSPLDTAPNWIDGTYAMPAIANRIIHITSAEDLAWLAQYVNAGHPLTSYKVVLEADIDLSGKLWTPIGTENTAFSGSFDGQGHTISGLTVSIWIDRYYDYGGCLFGYTSDADIRNTCLANAALTYGREGYWINAISNMYVTNCGAWGWACRPTNVRSDSKLSWSSFDTPDGNYSYIGAWNMDGVDSVTDDYLRSAEFREWINSCPRSGLYDWVADVEGVNNGFPRMATEVSLRTWEDVTEEVTPKDGVYEIYTPQQLGYIGKLINGGNTLSGKTVRLLADIDLSAYYWIPMSMLNADLDGNGHSITGLRVGNEDFPCLEYAGLIGTMNGDVTSLTIAGEIIGSDYAGMIAAYSEGEVTDCHGSGRVNGYACIGGLIGRAYGTISTSSFEGSVSTEDWGCCGGIVGQGGGIENCSFIGNVSGSIVGGIAGRDANVYRCSAEGTLNGSAVGGICGYESYRQIEDCYSLCDISGVNSAGGIIGNFSSANTIVINCYAGGSVGGVENVGALFGDLNGNNSNTFENCYWNQDAEYTLDGLPDTPRACGNGEELEGITALTAEQMRQQSSFAGFDFATVWAIDPSINGGMPYLRQEEAEYLPGDVNGDGAVNNKDVTRLMRYIKYGDVEVDEAALDVNGDGVVNNKDVTRLMRYIKYKDVDIF